MSVRPESPFTRTDLARFLDEKKIGNRMLFGGNLLRQPAFVQLKHDNPNSIRCIGDLSGADEIMNRSLFIGTYSGLSRSMVDYVVESLQLFCKRLSTFAV
jgi:CDP-4-dehydro-6-deoxyglucose reductase, E1